MFNWNLFKNLLELLKHLFVAIPNLLLTKKYLVYSQVRQYIIWQCSKFLYIYLNKIKASDWLVIIIWNLAIGITIGVMRFLGAKFIEENFNLKFYMDEVIL